MVTFYGKGAMLEIIPRNKILFKMLSMREENGKRRVNTDDRIIFSLSESEVGQVLDVLDKTSETVDFVHIHNNDTKTLRVNHYNGKVYVTIRSGEKKWVIGLDPGTQRYLKHYLEASIARRMFDDFEEGKKYEARSSRDS